MHRSLTLLLISLLLAGSAGAGYVFLFQSIKELNAETSVSLEDIHIAQAKADRLDALEIVVGATEEERAAILNYFLEPAREVQFVEFIEKLATDTGATVGITTLAPGPETDAYKSLSLTLTLSGTWPVVYRFLSLLEEMPYPVTMQSLSINTTSETPGKGTLWSATVSFHVLESNKNDK